MGEFLALALLLLIALGDEVNRCCKDWLKSMVTFKKKSQTDKFFPNSLADLYLKWINYYTFILQFVKSMSRSLYQYQYHLNVYCFLMIIQGLNF